MRRRGKRAACRRLARERDRTTERNLAMADLDEESDFFVLKVDESEDAPLTTAVEQLDYCDGGDVHQAELVRDAAADTESGTRPSMAVKVLYGLPQINIQFANALLGVRRSIVGGPSLTCARRSNGSPTTICRPTRRRF